jgi:hypothetical protein
MVENKCINSRRPIIIQGYKKTPSQDTIQNEFELFIKQVANDCKSDIITNPWVFSEPSTFRY